MKLVKIKDKLKEITADNVKAFIQGNARMLLDDGLFQTDTEDHIKQQVIWRAIKCKGCYDQKKCLICSCAVPGKWYAGKSCNTMIFGDLVDKGTWEKQKQRMGITWEDIVDRFVKVYADDIRDQQRQRTSNSSGITDDTDTTKAVG